MKVVNLVLLFSFGVMVKFGVSKELRRIQLGGYNDARPTDERAINAALFAVNRISQGEAKSDYSFAQKLTRYNERLESGMLEEGEELKIDILSVKSQVVAGMNYDMTVEVKIGGKCVGSFAVTVWDQFGDLEVTNWGKQVPCSLDSDTTNVDEEDRS